MTFFNTYYEHIQEAAEYISNRLGGIEAQYFIMMGTGLSELSDSVLDAQEIPYGDIPHFPRSTVQSHKGKLIYGSLGGKKVIVLAGRWHYYEGYSSKELTLPVRVMNALGINHAIFTNVSGGVNPHYQTGDLVLIKDHINLIPDHPLRGKNDERLGVRFPDMMHTYDEGMMNDMLKAAKEEGHRMHQGVYVALQGPSLETPAEYKFVKIIGGDLVGMSTVPEVIVAKHSEMSVMAISIVSNVCYPASRQKETTVEDVIQVAEKAAVDLNECLIAFLQKH